ncbi:MAG: SpoIIE family protein phosphatase, partial [Firmicutes bacterium]|nr:SpoIIE family protein phosphatase [Bacillota bacterium]
LITPEWLLSEFSWRLPEKIGESDCDRTRMDGVHHLIMGKLSILGRTFGELAAAYQGGPIGDSKDMDDSDGGADDSSGGRRAPASLEASADLREDLLPGQAWRSDIQEIDDPFEAASYDSPDIRAARAAAFIRSQACNGCPRYDVCWRDMVFRTYRDLVDLLAAIELFGESGTESLPDGFKHRCTRTERVIAASLTATGRRRAGATLAGRGRLGKGGQQGTEAILDKSSAVSILALQMAGVADAISRVSSQAQGMARFDEEAEGLIRRQLLAAGIGIKSVRVSWTGYGGLEVYIVKSPCRQDGECVRAIAPLVGDIIGRPVSVWQADCFYARPEGIEGGELDTDENGTHRSSTAAEIGIERLWKLKSGRGRPGECGQCSVRLLPARKYDLESEAVTLPRMMGETSGDSHAVVNLGDGRMAVIIADGMGVGEPASRESGAAVAMLVRLLEAGLDLDFAVQSVNAVMLLRSEDDRFTTVDLAVVDLYTGQAEMVKAGAPPSFIKRGHDVIAIGDPSVPAGVQAPTRVMRYRMNLEEGDILIMVSDGVTEAGGDGREFGMELVRVMERADSDLPRNVAEDVVEWARGTSPGARNAGGGGKEQRTQAGPTPTRQAAHGRGRRGGGGRDEGGRSIESRDDITVLAVRLSLADARRM